MNPVGSGCYYSSKEQPSFGSVMEQTISTISKGIAEQKNVLKATDR